MKELAIQESCRPKLVSHLTASERDILHLLPLGLTNREIGYRLSFSQFTVRNRISQLLEKFEARNRTDLVVKLIISRKRQHRSILP